VPTVAEPPKPAQAGVVLEREWIGVGQRARGVGRLVLGLPIAELGALGLGEAEVGALRVKRGTVVADVVRTFAGVTVGQGQETLKGEALGDALVELVLRGTLMKGAAESILDGVHGWTVLAQWARRERLTFPEPPASAQTLLRSRFEALGVQSVEDLQLVEVEDIIPDLLEMGVAAGLDPRVAASLPEQLPRRLELPGGRYACAVDVATRTVELSPLGSTKKEPAVGLLPRFQGFSVVFVKASRRLKLR
jgi:hypothetical protein